ncbi:MAG: hypothetical protein Q8L29_02965 [archaeon]|nr:hypothetical protein [archaeon]
MDILNELLLKVKEKKELSGLSNSFVSEVLEKHLKKIKSEKLTPSEKKIIIKEVRAELRRSAGMFQKGFKHRESFLEKGDIISLLKTHSSTAERIDSYPMLKNMISQLNAKSILDLGCGLNPLALASPDITYYAVDIRQDELNLIESFFKKNKIHGKVFIQDLRKSIDNLPSADLCLILKLFDIISQKHEKSEYIIKNVKCRNIIISFSTKTLSGKPMRLARRLWFERILSKLNYPFSIKQLDNEIFYIVEKN